MQANEENFDTEYPIDLLPETYSRLPAYLKVGFMVTRSGWSLREGLSLLNSTQCMKFPVEKAEELHQLAKQLRDEAEELFWATHPSAWYDKPPKK